VNSRSRRVRVLELSSRVASRSHHAILSPTEYAAPHRQPDAAGIGAAHMHGMSIRPIVAAGWTACRGAGQVGQGFGKFESSG